MLHTKNMKRHSRVIKSRVSTVQKYQRQRLAGLMGVRKVAVLDEKLQAFGGVYYEREAVVVRLVLLVHFMPTVVDISLL